VAARAEPSTHSKIEYVSAVVAASTHKPAAEKLQQALVSEKVVAALKERGFVINVPTTAPEK
jgi:ABC-type molybdate transport system substrate-binding protein